jgi:hypothetical protein
MRPLVLALALGGCTGDDDPSTPIDHTGHTAHTGVPTTVPAGIDWDAGLAAIAGPRSWLVTQGPTARTMTSTYAGTERLDGEDWDRYELGDLASTADDRFVGVGETRTPYHVRIKRLAWYPAGSADPGEVYTLDEPLDVAVDGAIGEPRTTSASGTLELFGTAYPIDATATITLEAVDETVPLPFGDLPGCARFAVEVTIGEPTVGFTLGLHGWVHPTAGAVATDDFLGGARVELAEAP